MKRHQDILEKLHAEKYVDVLELCKLFDVSAVTIRKDLNFLEQKGLLFRTHGGASLENAYINDRPVNEKEKLFIDEKRRIAEAAAAMIIDQDSIILASGTTVQALSKSIAAQSDLQVITASLNVAMELINHKDVNVLQLGGYVRHGSSSVVGDYAEYILDNVSCSKLFLGVDGIDLDFGLTTANLEEAMLNKKMIKTVQKTIVLADSSKFGRKGFGKICGLDQVNEIITDTGISANTVKRLQEMGVTVTIV